jgi:hypothetical protein
MPNISDITHIKQTISALDNDSFAQLREWFIEFDNARWDKQIEADSNSGKLDFLIDAAMAEHQAGTVKDL